MTDFPDGIIFAQAKTAKTAPKLDDPEEDGGNSHNGPICVLITYKSSSGDKVEVFFDTETPGA